jgi:hypothetical protein
MSFATHRARFDGFVWRDVDGRVHFVGQWRSPTARRHRDRVWPALSRYKRPHRYVPRRERGEASGGSLLSVYPGTTADAARGEAARASRVLPISSIERPFVSMPRSKKTSPACPYQKARKSRAGKIASMVNLGLT